MPGDWTPSAGRVLFEQDILTHPGRKRVAFAVPVSGLAGALRDAARADVVVEHVYDF